MAGTPHGGSRGTRPLVNARSDTDTGAHRHTGTLEAGRQQRPSFPVRSCLHTRALALELVLGVAAESGQPDARGAAVQPKYNPPTGPARRARERNSRPQASGAGSGHGETERTPGSAALLGRHASLLQRPAPWCLCHSLPQPSPTNTKRFQRPLRRLRAGPRRPDGRHSVLRSPAHGGGRSVWP